MELNWEQKFRAIRALDSDACLKTSCNGTWYLSTKVERKEGGVLASCAGFFNDPIRAICEHWLWATDPKHYLVVFAYQDKRKAVRWNGFMWEDVVEDVQTH